MNTTAAFLFLLLVALAGANLPWLTDRVLFILRPPPQGKREWIRLLEWFVMFCVVGVIAVGLEYRSTGQVESQDWEFYVVVICLFLVFALPGFIYHHDLRRHLRKRRRRAA
ncbi:membrane protease YdiL (CAAX protease family) [Natronocella acetinitrilica]|jgi:membrane protease YdiL (CAAX protease family)|uniref:Membrane protease YdiL (CAAX protease family) n=1 Tax=Natronocella acetinitrilica TaxID=414046 RepID=A0AAE3G5F3_9GAMM|nr:DUF2818 family protein [Natronocella acetinitrilica]MCP1674743.1 membrane protease YdiL (CAAX protease family) [Natronocella acetinitrilica]